MFMLNSHVQSYMQSVQKRFILQKQIQTRKKILFVITLNCAVRGFVHNIF